MPEGARGTTPMGTLELGNIGMQRDRREQWRAFKLIERIVLDIGGLSTGSLDEDSDDVDELPGGRVDELVPVAEGCCRR